MRMRLAGCRETGVLRQPASGSRMHRSGSLQTMPERHRRFSISSRLKNTKSRATKVALLPSTLMNPGMTHRQLLLTQMAVSLANGRRNLS